MKNNTKMDTHQIYHLGGPDAELRMNDVMKMFRYGFRTIGGFDVERVLDRGGTVEYGLAGGHAVMIKPFYEDAAIEVSVFPAGDDKEAAAAGGRIREEIENIIYIDYRAGYCCE